MCYDGIMTNGEHLSIPDNLPQLRSDLAPLYDLKPADYNRIINDLTNLFVAVVYLVERSGNSSPAQAIASHASEILLNYDDDVAGFVRASGMKLDTPEVK